MVEKSISRAIVLKRVPYGEADWIVTFFSRDRGRLSGIAKSGRKSLRRFGSGLEPGAVTELTYTIRPRSELVHLEESHVVFSTTGMMRSLARIEALGKALRLALSFLKEHQAAPDKFALMESYLVHLSRTDPSPAVGLGFELKWLALAGFEPLLDWCASCGGLPQGEIAFSAAQGGILCRRCMDRQRPAGTALSAGMRESMQALLKQPLGAPADIQNASAISSLLAQYIEYILEGPLVAG